MYINELAPESFVTVRLVREDKKYFDIKTTVVSLNYKHMEKLKQIFGNNFIVTKPMLNLTKVDISKCDIHVVCTKNKTPYIWNENVSLQVIKIKDTIYHVIVCNQNVANKGLRRSFRQEITVCGTVYLSNGSTDYVMIRDISLNGIGLSAAKDINVKENDEITLYFKDNECGFEFNLKLIVVRIKDMNDNKIVVGCKYAESQDYELSKYIVEKQRAGLKRKHKK